MPTRRTAWSLVLLLCAHAASARWATGEAVGVLWQEDFRQPDLAAQLGTEAWSALRSRLLCSERPDGVALQAAPGETMTAALRRRVPYDLETRRTEVSYPYLTFQLHALDPSPWSGLEFAVGDAEARRVLVRQADQAGLWVLDLGRLCPALRGGVGELPFDLSAAGATSDDAGPATVIGPLRMTSEAPDRLELDTTSASGAVRVGDQVTIRLVLAEPADGARCELSAAGPPRRAVTLDGRPCVDLAPADAEGRLWQATVDVSDQATPLVSQPGELVVKAEAQRDNPLTVLTPAWFTLATTRDGPARRTLSAVRLRTSPRVDGLLDDDCWRRVPPAGGFTKLNRDEPATQPTEVRVGYDEQNLYLAVTAHESQIGELKAAETLRDGKVYADDCVELFLAPRDDSQRYFQFVVNSRGTQFDSAYTAGGARGDLGWNAAWQAGTSVEDDRWTAELAIPFAVLGLGDGTTHEWGFNLTRERYAGGGTELSSWAPLQGGFHQPARFGRLTALELDLRWYLLSLGSPAVKPYPSGNSLFGRLRVPIANLSGRPQRLLAIATASQGGQMVDRVEHELLLEPGETNASSWSLRLPGNGDYDLGWSFASVVGGRLQAAGNRRFRIDWQALRAHWRQPAYRGCIYATQTIAEVVAEVTVDVPLTPDLRLVAELRGADDLVAAQALTPTDEQLTLTFPVPELPVGLYQLHLTLRQGERQIGELDLPLRKLSAAKGSEVRVGPDGVVMVDGRPFLGFGWYGFEWTGGSRQGPQALLDAGYNVVCGGLEPARAPAGLMVIQPLHRLIAGAPESRTGPLSEETKEKLKAAVAKVVDEPALLAWYLADEPEIQPIAPDYLGQVREYLAELDPYHPCIVLNDTLGGIERYAGTADILMPDPYPAPIEGGPYRVQKVADFVRQVRESAPQAGCWLTPQVCNLRDWNGQLQGRAPSYVEARCQTWLALLSGARGFVSFIYHGHLNYPQLRVGMPYLAREITALQPVILAPETTGVKVAEPLVSRTTRLGDELWVVVVNPTDQALDALFSSSALVAEPHLQVVAEGRQVAVERGQVSDHFGPYEVHVYTTGTAPELPTQVAIAREREAGEAARQRPGNLAFGRPVEVNQQYANWGWHLTDGVTDGLGWFTHPAPRDEATATISWDQPQTIGRVVLTAERLGGYRLEAWVDEAWQTIAQGAGGERRRELTFEPVTTTRLRLVAAPEQVVDVLELEAYEK